MEALLLKNERGNHTETSRRGGATEQAGPHPMCCVFNWEGYLGCGDFL